jgi:hypothetical protein
MQSKNVVRNVQSRGAVCLIPSAAAILFSSAVSAGSGVASALVNEGDDLGGGQIVTSINNPAVNHLAGWGFGVNTTDGITTLSHFFGNPLGGLGAIMRTEGTFGVYTQTGFESFWGMSNAGEIAYSPTVNEAGGSTGLDGVWIDDTPWAVEEQPSLVGGNFWVFGSRPGITADGQIYWAGGISSTQGGSSQNRGLFLGNTVVLLGGQAVPNLPNTLVTSGVDFDYRFSALGTNYIHDAQMTGSTASDRAIVLSGQGLIAGGTLVQESQVVPVSVGGNGIEAWQNFDFLGVTEDGQYMITGDTNAATLDEFIFKNGQMLYREGDIIDGVIVSGDIEAAYMNESGDIAYIWDHTGGTLEALFINDNLLLSEGDAVDWDGDGLIDAGFIVDSFTGISSLALSDRDGNDIVSVYFTADIATPGGVLEGGFTMSFQIPAPAALPLLGVAGLIGRRRRRA